MSKSIALIGCGNIGSRTLQSLLSIQDEALRGLDIWCFDPSLESLDLARSRADEISDTSAGFGHQTRFTSTLTDLPEALDLGIVSTTSAHRWNATKALLSQAQTKRLVLEKFLFTETETYSKATELFESAGVSCWVNCPRPAWPGYLDLARRIRGHGPIQARITGSNWAMASNAIHFLAALAALTGEQFNEFDTSRLDSAAIDNKRGGYKEISGLLGAIGSAGSRADIVCDIASRSGVTVDILSKAGRFILFEAQNKMLYQADDTDWQWREAEFRMLFASQMSEAFSQLLLDEDCPLPRYDEMVEPHLALMRVFNSIFFGPDAADQPCPVT